MLVKRLILIVVSLAFGIGATAGITYAIGTNPAEYGFIYFLFTALSLAVAVAIWLDKFMETRFLPK